MKIEEAMKMNENDGIDIAAFSACTGENCPRRLTCRRWRLYGYIMDNEIEGQTIILADAKMIANCISFLEYKGGDF
jgi:hypothetical protein